MGVASVNLTRDIYSIYLKSTETIDGCSPLLEYELVQVGHVLNCSETDTVVVCVIN
jgi:hypothetical protein